MLKHPKAEALAVNFAGQWLNLRGLDATAPLPLIYPDFDDPLRQAMRREVELLFDTIVREDRNILELLTADYTFVNERLAKHYGIKNIYGSQFRRVPLGPGMEARQGLLGKGAFLATTSKPERTSPVTRGKWVMTNLLGMPPPARPPTCRRCRRAPGDPNAKEPTMRQKMLDHRVRQDCVQCHRLMDPIGFALENFDAIGLWRTTDEGTPVDPKAQTFDNTQIDGPQQLRDWLTTKYDDQFVSVATEKLLTYALGRGVEYRDMPLVRAIARETHQEQRPLLVDGAGRRQEPAVPDEHEGRARRPRAPRARARRPTTRESTDHAVHHEEAHPSPHVPEGRRRHAGAAGARCDAAGRHRARADRGRAIAQPFRRHVLSARHGPGTLGAGGRRGRCRRSCPTSSSGSKG